MGRLNDTPLMPGHVEANIKWDVPMPTNAMFGIGSVTERFTAAAVLQLRDAGKLRLGDEITRWP